MSDWTLLLLPLLAVPIVLLFRFVGCGSFGTSTDPFFQIAVEPVSVTATQGGTAAATVTITSGGGYNSAVTLTSSGGPEVNALFAPNPVTPPKDATAQSAVTFSVAGSTIPGPREITISADDGAANNKRTAKLTLIVNTAPPPPPPPPPPIPFVVGIVQGTPRTNFTGWVGMVVLVGNKKLTVTQLGRIMRTASTASHEVKLVKAADGAELGTVTIPAMSVAEQGSAFAYAALQPAVVLQENTQYYVVSHEAAMGDTFFDINTTVTTTDDAQVMSGVYNEDNDNPDLLYQRPGGPGSTYGPVDFKYLEPA